MRIVTSSKYALLLDALYRYGEASVNMLCVNVKNDDKFVMFPPVGEAKVVKRVQNVLRGVEWVHCLFCFPLF